jgi:short-subunit dehydrogenase
MEELMLDNILIVGANRGIGLGLIREILNKNSAANVFATYRNKNRSTELIDLSKKHQNLKLLTLEINNQDSISNLKNELKNVPIDYFMINSGILIDRNSSIESVKEYELRETFAINTIGPTMILLSLTTFFLSAVRVRHRSPINAFSHLLAGLINYQWRPDKPAIDKNLFIIS